MDLDQTDDDLCEKVGSIFCCEALGDPVPRDEAFQFAVHCGNAARTHRTKVLQRERKRTQSAEQKKTNPDGIPSLGPGTKIKASKKGKKRIIIPSSEESNPQGNGLGILKPLENIVPESLRQH